MRLEDLLENDTLPVAPKLPKLTLKVEQVGFQLIPAPMWSTWLLVGLALSASGISIISVVITSYEVYHDLNLLATGVEAELRVFKGLTNEAWDDLIGIQWRLETNNHISSTKRRSIVERDVFVNKKGLHKIKTRQNVFLQQRLPAWCQCEPIKPACPPGPRGPKGSPGSPGEPGNQGIPGDNNYEVIRGPLCDIRITGCVRCPSGPPGNRGPMGFPGRPGVMGEQGLPGDRLGAGLRGSPGPSGDQGSPGVNGPSGEDGVPGKSGIVIVSKRGPPGLNGDGGLRGPPGRRGENGAPGIPGGQGPPGEMGFRGPRGEVGRPGFPGRGGGYGRDSGYCPCPNRTMLIAKKTLVQ